MAVYMGQGVGGHLRTWAPPDHPRMTVLVMSSEPNAPALMLANVAAMNALSTPPTKVPDGSFVPTHAWSTDPTPDE
jgi:hypothetical protein